MSKVGILITTAIASFLMTFIGSSVNIALPAISKDFSINAVLLSWIVTSYFLAGAIFLVPFGKIADIYGRKKVFFYGVLIYTLSSLFSALSPSAIVLIWFRIFQGIGSAMISGTSVAILTSVFPIGERGKALGINVSAVYLGLTLGPILGGLLTQHFGWRSIFLLNVPLGLTIIILILWKLKEEWAEAKEEKFDFIGSIIYGVSLISIMYGFSVLPSAKGILLVLTGIITTSCFVWWEIKTENPILDLKLFKNNSVFLFSNLSALIAYSSTFSVIFLLSLYLQYIKSLSPQQAGLILASQPIVMTIFSPFAGKLSDKIEPRIIASIGMGFAALSLFSFTFLSKNTNLSFVIFNLVLLGLGLAFFSSPNTNAVMSSVERRFYGVASALRGTMRLLGQTFSMGIAMLIFAIYIGKSKITPKYYPLLLTSMKVAFVVFTGLCFSGIIFSLIKTESS